MRIRFLTRAKVLSLHARALRVGGGQAGILNPNLFDSALNSPRAKFGGAFLNAFPYEMAASYLVGFARNHAFADGNKRTALTSALYFLDQNGFPHRLDEFEQITLVLDAATSAINKHRVADALRDNRYP